MRRRKPNISEEDFDKTQYVEKELIDKVSLWMLRIIFKLGGKKEFLNKDNYFYNDSVAYFLDLGKYVEMDSDDFNRNDVFKILQKKYSRLEQRKRLPAPKILTKNIKQISKLMDLNQAEEQILEFATIFKQYDILSDASQMLGRELNSIQTKKAISEILNIPLKEVDNAFKPNAKLVKSSVVSIEKGTNHNLEYKIDVISDDFIDNILNLDDDISAMLKEIVRPSDAGTLELKDYKHLSKDIDILLPYLENALHSKQKGVNVLFYGLPGTGKTELAKTISSSLNTKLYEISYADEDGEAISGKNRLKSYKIAQSLLVNQDIMLVYDEAEDIFDSRDNFFMPKRQSDKAWLNKILENNTIPTIWITNNINSVDNAMIRRFDIALEVPIPNKSKREEIIKNYSNDLLDEQSIKTLAQNENIAPALITRAAKVISAIKTKDKSKAFTQILNNTLKAQGYQEIKKTGELSLPSMYDPRFINTTTDLEKLTVGIKEYQNARVCLYGPAGTGKVHLEDI
jgi:SpoVK/Ycf46/Vps4 family AAA+-type ATPase